MHPGKIFSMCVFLKLMMKTSMVVYVSRPALEKLRQGDHEL
jgi:hypothetical protein